MIEDQGDPSDQAGDGARDPELAGLLARLDEVTSLLATYDMTPLGRIDQPSAELVEAGLAVEVCRRRLGGFDTNYVRALEAVDEPRRRGAVSTATFLRLQLRLSPAEARRRVVVAGACAAREGFGAGQQEPRLPALATARQAGMVSDEHAIAVVDAIDRLPKQLPAEVKADAEERLVADAHVLDPPAVAMLGRRLLDVLDPDGTLKDDAWHEQNRTASLTRRRDGGGDLRARLTPAAFEALSTCLQPLCKPIPAGPDGPDQRTPGMRLQDAFHDLANKALASGDLPASGGVPATVILMVDANRAAACAGDNGPGAEGTCQAGIGLTQAGQAGAGLAETGLAGTGRARTGLSGLFDSGLVETGLGSLIPAQRAKQLADQACVYTLLRDSKGVPLHLGRANRIATTCQTIALTARDRGCTFPGCDRPASWTQRHHIRDWALDGQTDLNNLCLLCGHHHRTFQTLGWEIHLRDGRPWFKPPTWIDPRQALIRNTHWDPINTS